MHLQIVTIVECGGQPVRALVPSPNLRWLTALLGDGRSWVSNLVLGARLLGRSELGWSQVRALPRAAAQVFTLDDGAVVIAESSSERVELTRFDAAGEKSWTAFSGTSLSDPAFALLRDGVHALIEADDRDDGQGYSPPEYRTFTARVDLRGDAATDFDSSSVPLQRSPGAPTLSPFGREPLVRKVIQALPFRREWPVCVGSSKLVTTSRLIAWPTGQTLAGERRTEAGPSRRFFDLSVDEKLAVGCDRSGKLELWDGAELAATLDLGEVRCAAFVGPREVAVGTAQGRVLFIAVE